MLLTTKLLFVKWIKLIKINIKFIKLYQILNGQLTKVSEYPIDENYRILYNDNYQSKDDKNEILKNLVAHNDIKVPIIFISNSNIRINDIKVPS